MKVLLAITLLFAAVHSATIVKRLADMIGLSESNSTLDGARGIRHKRYAEKPDISLINEMRRAVASAGGITMPDLEWDEQLVAAAKDMNSDCDEVKHGPNYRYFMEGPNDNALKMVTIYYAILLALDQMDNIPLTTEQRNKMMDAKQAIEAQQDKITFMIFELFNPAQTKIGCAQSRCDGRLPAENKELVELARLIGMDGLTYSFDIMCAIGPHRSWKKDELQKIEYAAKGTDVMNKKSFMSSGSSIGVQLVLVLSLLSFLM